MNEYTDGLETVKAFQIGSMTQGTDGKWFLTGNEGESLVVMDDPAATYGAGLGWFVVDHSGSIEYLRAIEFHGRYTRTEEENFLIPIESIIPGPSGDLKYYQCIKKVRACKIESVNFNNDQSGVINPIDGSPFTVSPRFVEIYEPGAGGYFIIDEDGEESYLPESKFNKQFKSI
jgi:hypothetical protein